MEQEETKLKKFIQSPWSLTVIVVCIATVLIIFVTLSLQTKNPQTTNQVVVPTEIQAIKPSTYPTTNPLLISSSLSFIKHGSWVDVMLDTGIDRVSGVQVVVSFDPKIVTNVAVTPGTFFDNPTVLQNSIDITKGILSYTLAIKPGKQPKIGQGTLISISYSLVPGSPPTTLSFLSQTKITSEGVNSSVLKKTTSITLP